MLLWINELLYAVSMALDFVERDLIGVKTNHSKRVAYFCLKMGQELGLSEAQLSDLCCCAVLHDNALTEYILSERAGDPALKKINLATHCVLGEANATHFPFLGNVTGFIHFHHENADGSGPFRKYADEIPLGAALIRIADGVDARYDLSDLNDEKRRKVLSYIKDGKERLFAKREADAMLAVLEQLDPSELYDENIRQTLKRLSPATCMDCSNEQLMDFAAVLAKIIDYKSSFTRKHSIGIAEKAHHMAKIYGYDPDKQAQVYLAAALHDLGKLAVPTEILEKPGKLTHEEYEEIKKHALYSYKMLDQVSGFEQIRDWAALHHEKLDGTGYPFGKKEGELDQICRLMACIDIYQAVSEERPYHPARNHADTMKVLYSMAEKGQIDQQIAADLDRNLAVKEAVLC